MFGWVRRDEFDRMQVAWETATASRREIVQRLELADAQHERDLDAADGRYLTLKELYTATRAELEAANAERKMLFDRIVQMTGQPAIYAPPQAAPTSAPAESASSLPGPPVRASFDDVHKAARQAIKDGTYKLRGVVN